jgi:hypothetical protein
LRLFVSEQARFEVVYVFSERREHPPKMVPLEEKESSVQGYLENTTGLETKKRSLINGI